MDRSPRPRLAEATEAELGRTISCELYCYLNTERSVAEARRCFQRGTRKNKRNGSQNPHGTPGAQPQFFQPRTVPLALRARVEKELEKLVEEKVIEPVQFSEWAAPIPVFKENGSVRICSDYKVTVKKFAKRRNTRYHALRTFLQLYQVDKLSPSWT